MPAPTTQAVLDFQSNLTRTSTPANPTDVVNKAYVDAAVAGATIPDATSAPGGGTKGKATFDSNLGLEVTSGVAGVKVDGTTVTFNGSGELQSSAAPPDGTSAPGGGVIGVVSADSNKGLEITSGVMGVFPDPNGALINNTTGLGVKVDTTKAMSIVSDKLAVEIDNSTVGFNGSGQLQTIARATSANGGGVIGEATYDEASGMHVAAGTVVKVKVDGVTMQFDGSGNLKSVGGAGPTGLVSNRAPWARAIIAGPPTPSIGVIGSNTNISSYPHGSTTGERFEFTVPDDYYTGNLSILILYNMSAAVASPNNQIRLTTAAELAKVTGSIDNTTYPTTPQNFLTPTTTNITRQLAFTLTSGTFEAGDDITISIQRLGGDANDLSTAAFQVIAYEWTYTAVVNSRLANQVPEFTQNATSENPTGSGNIGTETDVETFPTSPDSGTKFAGIVPDNWDGVSPCFISLTYSMSSAASGASVELNTYGDVADSAGGTIESIPSANFIFSPPNDTNPHRLLGFASIPAGLLSKGDHITAVLARRTAVGGNHPGTFQLIGITFQFAVAPAAGFNQITTQSDYLAEPVYGNISGSVTETPTYPNFSGSTFDKLYTLASTSASGRVDAAFAGRLAVYQSTINNIRINIVGAGSTPQYHLQVYAEGTVGPVYDSGLQSAPGTVVELVVIASSLSAQPNGSKRYQVVVQAFINSGDSVAVSLPFVEQE